MDIKNDLLRLSVSTFVFCMVLLLVSNIHNDPYLSLYETIHLNCVTFLIGCVYLTIYICMRRGLTYVSKYKAPFTFFHIMVHVYGLGFLLFVSSYCIFNSTIYCTLLFVIGLAALHLDNLTEHGTDSIYHKGLKASSSILGMIVVLLSIFGQWDHVQVVQIFNDMDIFQIVFVVCLPVIIPIIFNFIHLTQYTTHFSDVVLDLFHYAMPFACIISSILLTVFHSCLNPNGVPQTVNTYNLFPLFLLPLFALPAMYIMLLFVFTKNTGDVVVTLSLAITLKHLYLHSSDETSIYCFLGAILMVLFRMLYSWDQHLKYEHDSKVRLDSPDTESLQRVPISDNNI